jgi:hypothetical protein
MSTLQTLESSLNDLFAKQAPDLPTHTKKSIVKYLPWISLFMAFISLYAAVAVWHWAHAVNDLLGYAVQYGGAPGVERMTFGIWFSLLVLIVEGLLYLAAFRELLKLNKSGWNLLFYGLLVNLAYGLLSLLIDYSYGGGLIGTLIGSAIGFYFLFQIRTEYLAKTK